jgi:hypothetical protein
MARRGIPKKPPKWYLPEWMAACGLSGRGAQSKMMELTNWSKATMSQLYTGKQDFNSEILDTASAALHCEPHELLMHPDQAFAVRRLRETAAVIVADVPAPPKQQTDSDEGTGTHG